MGFLDSMFGGGTAIALALDTTTASPGGVVGGKVTLVGGNKPLRLTDLSIRIMFVETTMQDDSPLPKIDIREVAKQTVAAGTDLPPGSQQTFAFRVSVPHDLPPTAHNVTFQVSAVADIPGVKDPSASAELRVIEASENANHRLPLEEIYMRWPALRGTDEGPLGEALYEFFLACYSEGASLMEAEPVIVWHLQNGTVGIRKKALEAWSNLVDNRVTPQHLQTLYGVANLPGLDEDTFEQVIIAATKFAEEGALPLVQHLAVDPRSDVRAKVAANLRFNAADKFNGKRELLVQLAQDSSSEVRKAAVGALSCFRDDQQLMYWVANMADQDPDADVQAECIGTLGLVHHHGMGELALSVYEKHCANPNARVRSEISRNLSWQPQTAFPRVWGIVQRLAQDTDEEVRKSLAFQFNNMSDLPQLLPIAQHMAERDPSSEVRNDAMGAMAALMRPDQAIAYYQSRFQQAAADESMMWAVLNGARHHREHPHAKQLLTHIGQCHFPHVANAAREALSS